MPQTKSKKQKKFIEICCPRCKNCVVVYSKSATHVKCAKCNKLLVKATGGKTKINAKVTRIITCKK